MTVRILDKEMYSKMLYDLYAEDELFVKKWNLDEGDTLDEMIEKGVKTLIDHNVLIYVIEQSGEILAYFGKQVFDTYTYLTGFFIKVSHRKQSFVSIFFKFVKEVFNSDEIYCNIHKNNKPAVHFILKNGQLQSEENSLLTFKLN